jgi:muramoyltetrapeptide carboxypeptidase LdcA involved in peptidoglycan recycling
MIQPSYLQKGDTVAIVSTARKITSDKIIPAIKLLDIFNYCLTTQKLRRFGVQEAVMAQLGS